MIIAAALSIQDPRERPVEKAQAAAEQHNRRSPTATPISSPTSTCGTTAEQQRELSSSQFRRMCRKEFLNYLRVREWQDLHAQLRQVVRDLGIRVNAAGAR